MDVRSWQHPSDVAVADNLSFRAGALRPRRSAIRYGSSRSVSEPRTRDVSLTNAGLCLLAEARCRIVPDRPNRDGQR